MSERFEMLNKIALYKYSSFPFLSVAYDTTDKNILTAAAPAMSRWRAVATGFGGRNSEARLEVWEIYTPEGKAFYRGQTLSVSVVAQYV